MLLSTFIPKGITWFNSKRDACGRGLFPLHIFHVCTSLSACLWQIILNALSRAGEILLPVGYLPHFFLREAQHVIRFHFDRDSCPDRFICLVRVCNLVCEDWQIRT